PYFVMELVQGDPITAYADREKLSIRARLELFQQVCDAVQHAHQKGIIHRDLKPSNIVVAEVDGRPTPRIIDFGIAKATGVPRDLKQTNILVAEVDGRTTPGIIDFGIAKATGGAGGPGAKLTDRTAFTEIRQFVGTPEYMSPEQAGMDAAGVDTRSDIYSLGV